MSQVERGKLPSSAGILVLFALLALVAWDASARIGRSLDLSGRYDVAVRAPESDMSSLTGYTLHRRSLLGPVFAPDALHWVMQTQEMSTDGAMRVRHVDYDNAPAGRAVHWSAPYRWWLLLLARIDHAVNGLPIPQAIERSVLWAGPVMLGLFLVMLVPLLLRSLGVFAAVVMGVGLVGCSQFTVQFIAGNADHHAAVTICAIATVLLLVQGRTHRGARTRRWHVASAMAGAIGMWLSAVTLIPVLIGIGLGALSARAGDRTSPSGRLHDEDGALWRWWGATGAVASMLAYLIEYAPDSFGWRLEVNHPLYALAWLAGGELLCRLTGHAGFPKVDFRGRAAFAWCFALAALVLPGVLILFLGPRVFLLSDTFLQSLHSDTIAEFQTLPRFLSGRILNLDLAGRLAPVVLFVISLAWVVRRGVSPGARSGLAVATGPAAVLLLLTCFQIRWWGIASALCLLPVALAIAQSPCRSGSAGSRSAWRLIVLAFLLPGILTAMRTASQADEPTESDVRRLAERDIAHRLRLCVGGDALVVLAAPDSTTSLIYFAGAKGLGTMYWENVDGLKKTAEILGALDMDVAHEQIRRAGVTHVVVFPWDAGDAALVRLGRHLPQGAPLPSDSLAAALRDGRVSVWLKPLPHRLPDHPLLRAQEVRIFEVTEFRSPERVAIDAAVFLMESGRTAEAANLEAVLSRYSDNLAAQATLAAMQARRRDTRAFAGSLSRVLALLSQSGTAPLDDCVRIAAALAIGGREDLAAAELRRGLAAADASAVRRLTPGSLSDLLELSDALNVPFPEAGLAQMAEDLAMRKRP